MQLHLSWKLSPQRLQFKPLCVARQKQHSPEKGAQGAHHSGHMLFLMPRGSEGSLENGAAQVLSPIMDVRRWCDPCCRTHYKIIEVKRNIKNASNPSLDTWGNWYYKDLVICKVIICQKSNKLSDLTNVTQLNSGRTRASLLAYSFFYVFN